MAGSVENSSVTRDHILVLPAEYPDLADPLEFNGSWAEDQTRALARRYPVSVVYPLLAGVRPPAVEEYHSGDLATYIVRYRHVPKSWLLSYAFALRRGIKASGALRPACIHVHGLYPAGLMAVGLGRWLNVPVVITEHWGRLRERVDASRSMAVMLPLVLRSATTPVAVSDALASEMVAIEPRCRPVVVANTVRPEFFELPLPAAPSRADPLRLLFVGSLNDERKGLGDLLRAIALYEGRPAGRRVHLRVIGDGAARPGFERLAQQLGLGQATSFLGKRSRGDVVAVMGDCDGLAVPSRYETFGVVFAEAMASGKPVIACLGGPAEEVVPAWAGLLVPPREPEALCAAITRLAVEPGAFDGARSRSHARDRFGPDAFLDAMTRVFEGAMQHAREGEPPRR